MNKTTCFSSWKLDKSNIFQVYQYFIIYGSTFSKNLNIFREYVKQQSLKLGGTNYHFKWVKVPGTAPYSKAWWI